MAALRAPVAPKQKEGVVRRQCRQIAPLAAVLAAAEAVVVSAGRRGAAVEALHLLLQLCTQEAESDRYAAAASCYLSAV